MSLQLLKICSACILDMAATCDNTDCKPTFLSFSTSFVWMTKGTVLGMVVLHLLEPDFVQQRKGSACKGENEPHHFPPPAVQSK